MARSLWKSVISILLLVAMAHLFVSIYLNSTHFANEISNVDSHGSSVRINLNTTLEALHNELLKLKSRRQYNAMLTDKSYSQSLSKSTIVPYRENHIPLVPKDHQLTKIENEKTMAFESTSMPPKRNAVLFTMDSISSYEENSKKGGAAGEILIRKSLEYALTTYFNVDVKVIKSDDEFDTINANLYDFIILDPWTWAGPGKL